MHVFLFSSFFYCFNYKEVTKNNNFMILPYFLSLRRSRLHTLPNTLSLSLSISLSTSSLSRSLPFILPYFLSLSSLSLSLSLSVSMYLYQYYFNRYTHSRIEYRGKYIDKGFI